MSPAEYLRRLEETPGSYRALLDKHGGDLTIAAHELATVKLRAYRGSSVPSAREVYVAGREIACRASYIGLVPPVAVLRSYCERAGLPCI